MDLLSRVEFPDVGHGLGFEDAEPALAEDDNLITFLEEDNIARVFRVHINPIRPLTDVKVVPGAGCCYSEGGV